MRERCRRSVTSNPQIVMNSFCIVYHQINLFQRRTVSRRVGDNTRAYGTTVASDHPASGSTYLQARWVPAIRFASSSGETRLCRQGKGPLTLSFSFKARDLKTHLRHPPLHVGPLDIRQRCRCYPAITLQIAMMGSEKCPFCFGHLFPQDPRSLNTLGCNGLAGLNT